MCLIKELLFLSLVSIPKALCTSRAHPSMRQSKVTASVFIVSYFGVKRLSKDLTTKSRKKAQRTQTAYFLNFEAIPSRSFVHP